MSLASAILARRMHLVRPQSCEVLCERDLCVAMDDGTVLLADRWVAAERRAAPQPTVLVRSPYGRRQIVGLILGRLLAERGLQVVLQSVRGTFGSGGEFSPFDERGDGLATLRWLRAQPWHAGGIGMIGPSYLGLVQWALAAGAGEDLAALSIQASASQFHGQTYAGGSLSLQTVASWLVLVAAQERRLAPLAMTRALRGLPRLLESLPISELDVRATGAEVPWFRDGLASPSREEAYWVARDFAAGVGEVSAHVQLIGGWQDIFLPWMLEDYAALRAAGRPPQLIIGPWTHTSPGLAAAGLREGIAWLRAYLLDDPRMLRADGVRVYVTRASARGEWRELPDWPAPGTREQRLWLAPHGVLAEAPPALADELGTRYRYDPLDPTPSLGGPTLLAREAVLDNRPLERRADVLTFTSAPLAEDREAIGPVRVELYARASSPHFDLFARVCDVDRCGVSWNVCDALHSVLPGGHEQCDDGVARAAFELWPTAHRFAAGHRIRLQVSSGAYPRYARNPGSGQSAVHAGALRAVEVELLHDTQHPSLLRLPTAA